MDPSTGLVVVRAVPHLGDRACACTWVCACVFTCVSIDNHGGNAAARHQAILPAVVHLNQWQTESAANWRGDGALFWVYSF